MTSAEIVVGGSVVGNATARIQGVEILVDLPVLAPVGEYELRLLAKNAVVTFPFIVVLCCTWFCHVLSVALREGIVFLSVAEIKAWFHGLCLMSDLLNL